jgi:hypothetical protein
MAMAAPLAAEGAEAAAGRAAGRKAADKAASSRAPGKAPASGSGTRSQPRESTPRERGAGPEQERPTDSRGYAKFRGQGKGKGKRRSRALAWAWSGNKRILTAEFVLCAAILILGAFTSKEKDSAAIATKTMVKGSALALIFFLLAILTAGKGGAAKTATAIGTLITTAYAVTSPDVHAVVVWLRDTFSSKIAIVNGETTEKTAAMGEAENDLQPAFPGTES